MNSFEQLQCDIEYFKYMDFNLLPEQTVKVPDYYKDYSSNRMFLYKWDMATGGAYSLILHYCLSNNNLYLTKACNLMNIFAHPDIDIYNDNSTNITYIYKAMKFIMAARSLKKINKLDSLDINLFNKYINNIFIPVCKRIKDRSNNFGAWGLCGLVLANDYLDNEKELDKLENSIIQFIGNHCAAKDLKLLGINLYQKDEFFRENLRNNSGIYYTFFTLDALTRAGHYYYIKGKSSIMILLEKAIKKHFDYCLDPALWPYKKSKNIIIKNIQDALFPSDDYLVVPVINGWPVGVIDCAAKVYNENIYKDYVNKLYPCVGVHSWKYSSYLFENELY